jgi:hypothetical protein
MDSGGPALVNMQRVTVENKKLKVPRQKMGDPYIRKAYFHGITCPGIVLVERVNNARHLHKMTNRCAGPLAHSPDPECLDVSISLRHHHPFLGG